MHNHLLKILTAAIIAVFIVATPTDKALAQSLLWERTEFRNHHAPNYMVETNGMLAAFIGAFYDRYLDGVRIIPPWAGERLTEYVLQGMAAESFMINLPWNVAYQHEILRNAHVYVERAESSPRSFFGLYQNFGEFSEIDILLPMLHYCTRDEFIWITIFEMVARANSLGHHKSALLTELLMGIPETMTNHETVALMDFEFILAGGFAYDSTIDRLLLHEYNRRGEAHIFFEYMFSHEEALEASFNASPLGKIVTFQQFQTAREVDWQLTIQANAHWTDALGGMDAPVNLREAFIAHIDATPDQARREINRLAAIIFDEQATDDAVHIAATELRWGIELYNAFAETHGIKRVLAVRDDDLNRHSERFAN